MHRLLNTIANGPTTNLRRLLLGLLIAGLIAPIAFADPVPPIPPPPEPPALEPMDETDEITDPDSLEPMDETDEITDPDFLEPMDETDEITGDSTWLEIAGSGLLEIVPTTNGQRIRHHPWCPWTERSLSASACARQVWIDTSRRLALRKASAAASEVVSLGLSSAALLVVDSASGAGLSATLFDGSGRRLAELSEGSSAWLDAGRAYLRIETWPATEALGLDVSID